MNKAIMMGRLTKDPEIRYGGMSNTCVARFSIAVDRRFKRDGEPAADFFNVTAFGKLGEFVEKYLRKGTKILLDGEIQNDNYTNREGQKVYGTRIVASGIEFAESKSAENRNTTPEQTPMTDWTPTNPATDIPEDDDGWTTVDDDLPFD